MHFTVNEQGDTSDVQAVTGNKMLQDAAIKNIQDWKFWPSRCACRVKGTQSLFTGYPARRNRRTDQA